MRIRTDLNDVGTNKRYQLSLNDFGGVDFSSTTINCSQKRSPNAQNLIRRNGLNQKRFGWSAFFKATDRINGVWKFINEDMQETVIVKVGSSFYSMDAEKFKSFDESCTATKITTPDGIINNEKCYGFVNNNRLYVFCGMYLVYGKFDGVYKFIKVEDIATVPTTTISITSTTSTVQNRTKVSDVNLLTDKRINKLCMDTDTERGMYEWIDKVGEQSYYLSTSSNEGIYIDRTNINFDYPNDLDLIWSHDNNGNKFTLIKFQAKTSTSEAQIIAGPTTNYGTLCIKETEEIYYRGKEYLTPSAIINQAGASGYGDMRNEEIPFFYYTESEIQNESLIRKNPDAPIFYHLQGDTIDYILDTSIDTDSELNITIETSEGDKTVEVVSDTIYDDVLYLDDTLFGRVDRTLGKLTFYRNIPPLIEGRDNVTVEFKHYLEGNKEKINNCKFGIMFGYGGNRNNLFVSGNENFKNIDWYSEDNDPTYFSDVSVTAFGSDDTAIVGYQIINDGTVAIFKEESYTEPTIYYRTTTLRENTDEYEEEIFPVTVGNIGEAPITRHSLAFLNGDNLILSRHGVFGIKLSSNISTEQRYAYERSKLINTKLCNEAELDKAVGITHNGKYYLSVNGNCYVADSTQMFKALDDVDTFQYEWWYWTNVPAYYWFVMEDRLCFGTEDGTIAVFKEENFVDDKIYHFDSGSIKMGLDGAYSRFTFDSSRLEDVKKATYFDVKYLHFAEQIINVTTNNGGSRFAKDKKYLEENYTFGTKLLMTAQSTTLSTDVVLSVVEYTYDLIDNLIENASDGVREFALYGIVDKIHPTKIGTTTFWEIKYDTVCKTFSYLGESFESLDDISMLTKSNIYNHSLSDFEINAHEVNNVEAFWYTPALNFGNNQYTKTIRNLITTCETVSGGVLTVGIQARDYETLDLYSTRAEGINTFDFNNIDFNNFTFETSDFAKTFAKRCRVKNKNYYSIWYECKNDKNCAIHDVSVVYQFGKKIRGVK